MKQLSLATGFERYGRVSRRAVFLAKMDQVVPWAELCVLVEPYYPKAGRGRRPVGLERMLRLYFLQNWFNLSDPGLEDALYESVSMREFVGIDLGHESVPDETTVCKFRHLLERNGLGQRIFERVKQHLQERGLRLSAGTIVDATVISAPNSTKNRSGQRDPEMGNTKKGGQWYHGMKAHIAVDASSKLIHTVVATPANVGDARVLPQLLHGQERGVWGDRAYVGMGRVIKQIAPKATERIIQRAYQNRPLSEFQQHMNRINARIRSRVEHVFGVIKCVFGFNKLRYKGLAKNENRLYVVAALANLHIARPKLV